MDSLFSVSLYLLALINPVSKVFILSVMAREGETEIRKASIHASIIALVILLIFDIVGNYLLTQVFRVEIYALKASGGIILFSIGFKALSKGVFFEADEHAKLSEVSIVPLASPMIAGPATITAVVSLSAERGFFFSASALTIAIAANLVIMLLSNRIGALLRRRNLMGAAIRITGLIVATIAAQMVFNGVADWYARTLARAAA